MQNSKLLQLLRCFTATQWRQFGKFVRSPYFNKREDVVALYDYLNPGYPDFSGQRVSREQVLQHWPAAADITEKDLAVLMNRLLQEAERFLVVESVSQDPEQAGIVLLEQLRRMNLRRHFSGYSDKLRKQLETARLQDSGYFQIRFELAWLEYQALEDPYRHQFNPHLQESSDCLDAWYLARKLRLLCEMATQERILAVRYENPMESALIQLSPEGFEEREPVLALYLLAWRMIRDDEPADFERFLSLLTSCHGALPDSDLENFYTFALNFCTRRINLFNDPAYYHVYLDISERLLKSGMLLEKNEFPPWRFINIASAGIRTRRWEWTFEFIQTWRSKLPAGYADNLYGYVLAYWYYGQKRYADAQKLLATVEFQDIMLAVAARTLLIRVYFEAGDTELLFNALESTRLFLMRNETIEPQRRRQIRQFINYTRRLARIFPPDPAKLKALADDLPPAAEIMHRDWLLDQIQE